MALLDHFRTASSVDATNINKLKQRVFRQAPQTVWTTHSDETVVFDIERGKYESLNDVASRVWGLLADGATFDSITATIADEYDLPPDAPADRVQRDVAALLMKLVKTRIVVTDPM